MTAQATLSLHQAIAFAQESPQAAQAQDRIDAAQGLLTQAGLRPNPRFYLQSEDLRPWDSTFDFPNQTEDYAYVGQLFELGGKRTRRVEFARANLLQAQADRSLALMQLAGHVAAAYFTAVADQGIVTLLVDDLRAVDRIVQYNQARVDAGAMRGIDLIRTQIERDRLSLALATARREATLAQVELYRQIGQPANPTAQLTDTLEASPALPPAPLADILATRPDLLAAREAVTAAQDDLRLQQALGKPDLDLSGGYKRNNGADTLYTQLQLPLTFRNRNQGEVARAQASLHLAQHQLQQLELSVAAELAAAREAYTQQQAVLREILPDMRARAHQNQAILDDAYRTGGVDLLRYLDAERTAFEVEVTALHTLADFQQAGLRLQLAQGITP